MRRKVVERKPVSGVESVAVETRKLHVFRSLRDDIRAGDVEGSIVWIEPGPEEDVSSFVVRLKELKAERVVVLPSRTGDAPLPERAVSDPAPASASLREIVFELVEELPADVREQARGIVESCLSQASI